MHGELESMDFLFEQKPFIHTINDEIVQGQRQHSTALSLCLSTVALLQWGFLMYGELACHSATKLQLNPFLDASDWTMIVFDPSKFPNTGAYVISFLTHSLLEILPKNGFWS